VNHPVKPDVHNYPIKSAKSGLTSGNALNGNSAKRLDMRLHDQQAQSLIVKNGSATMTKASLLVVSAAAAALFASGTDVQAQGRPSWCRAQENLNLAEATICSTRSLWDKDYQLTIIYESALDSVGRERSRLQHSQQDWLRVTRNGCNADDTCLDEVYDRRIDTLRRIDNRGYMNPNE
jgi:uncharacterized protein YecT (DUF1311 family)